MFSFHYLVIWFPFIIAKRQKTIAYFFHILTLYPRKINLNPQIKEIRSNLTFRTYASPVFTICNLELPSIFTFGAIPPQPWKCRKATKGVRRA